MPAIFSSVLFGSIHLHFIAAYVSTQHTMYSICIGRSLDSWPSCCSRSRKLSTIRRFSRCSISFPNDTPSHVPSNTRKSPIDETKVYETTVAIIPPDEYWGSIQALRLQLRDSGLYRWPPHINLLYPFIPVKYFPDACSRLLEAVREISPFDISLNELRLFKRKTSATLWLLPETSIHGGLEHLQVGVSVTSRERRLFLLNLK